MENKDVEKYAIVGGAVATIALVVLAWKSQNGTSTAIAPQLNTIVRQVSPETVALRGLKTQTDLAEIGAKASMFGTLTGYLSALDTNEKSYLSGLDTNATSERVTKYLSDNDVSKAKVDASAVIDSTKIQAESINQTARIQSETAQKEAYYNYESTRQSEKTKRNSSVWSTVGNIATGFLKFI